MTQKQFVAKMNKIAKDNYKADYINFKFISKAKNGYWKYELHLAYHDETHINVFDYIFNYKDVDKLWSIKDLLGQWLNPYCQKQKLKKTHEKFTYELSKDGNYIKNLKMIEVDKKDNKQEYSQSHLRK